MEEEIWRHGRDGTASAAPAGGRESPPETAGRRSQSGQGNNPKKVLRPVQKCEAVEYLLAAYRIGVRRGCRLMMQSRTVYNYRSCRDDRALTQRIREIAETRIRYGVQRIHILLLREGWLVNHKKTHRIYCLEGLNLRSKRPRRHVTARHRRIRPAVTAVDQCWSMDFVADNLFNGRRI
uniref:Insertion element IS2A uncharacterized 48,2 kDa protein n=1 Tax=Erwinia piriflorinigrans CFBP 5888 TaxID=1161919 RepID=V5Z2K0_9GAMM|nr:insertion element IS2A uncharacterized 48,2 kDa protein [Erwinia piriflorinigrans CFBP 5888]